MVASNYLDSCEQVMDGWSQKEPIYCVRKNQWINVNLTEANGEIAMIWLGGGVSPQIIDDLYGVESLEELDTRIVRQGRIPVSR